MLFVVCKLLFVNCCLRKQVQKLTSDPLHVSSLVHHRRGPGTPFIDLLRDPLGHSGVPLCDVSEPQKTLMRHRCPATCASFLPSFCFERFSPGGVNAKSPRRSSRRRRPLQRIRAPRLHLLCSFSTHPPPDEPLSICGWPAGPKRPILPNAAAKAVKQAGRAGLALARGRGLSLSGREEQAGERERGRLPCSAVWRALLGSSFCLRLTFAFILQASGGSTQQQQQQQQHN